MDNKNTRSNTIPELIDAITHRTMLMDLAWDWPAGVALYGVGRAWQTLRRQEYLDYLVQWTDTHLQNGIPRLTVNAVSLGHLLLILSEATGDEKYGAQIDRMAEYLTKDAVRFGEGVFQHTVSQNYNFPEQAWADTLFMCALFLLKYGLAYNHTACIRDALNQYHWHETFLQSNTSNLYYHAWDNVAKNNMSSIYWGRANAWSALTGAEALRQINAMNPAFMSISDALRDQLSALVRLQTPSGLWRTVLDDPESYEETSASAGIAAALVIHSRIMGHNLYASNIKRAFEGLCANIDTDGCVRNVSAGTAVMADAHAYKIIAKKRIQGWGQGLALAFLAEMVEQ